jgi:Phycobilisome degradation protein nblA
VGICHAPHIHPAGDGSMAAADYDECIWMDQQFPEQRFGWFELFTHSVRGVLMMELPLSLSLEQNFNLKVYEDQVKGLSQQQAQEYLLEVMRQLMIKDNVIRHLMKTTL